MRLEGLVVRGDGLGRTLGFPTANVAFEGEGPERGVWAVTVEAAGLPPAKAVCNVGVRPTVSGAGKLTVEVHIPGFSGELYGQRLRIMFLAKLRDEKLFGSLEELKAQIAEDVAGLLIV